MWMGELIPEISAFFGLPKQVGEWKDQSGDSQGCVGLFKGLAPKVRGDRSSRSRYDTARFLIHRWPIEPLEVGMISSVISFR